MVGVKGVIISSLVNITHKKTMETAVISSIQPAYSFYGHPGKNLLQTQCTEQYLNKFFLFAVVITLACNVLHCNFACNNYVKIFSLLPNVLNILLATYNSIVIFLVLVWT